MVWKIIYPYKCSVYLLCVSVGKQQFLLEIIFSNYNNCIYRTCGQVWGNLKIKNKLLTHTFSLNIYVCIINIIDKSLKWSYTSFMRSNIALNHNEYQSKKSPVHLSITQIWHLNLLKLSIKSFISLFIFLSFVIVGSRSVGVWMGSSWSSSKLVWFNFRGITFTRRNQEYCTNIWGM